MLAHLSSPSKQSFLGTANSRAILLISHRMSFETTSNNTRWLMLNEDMWHVEKWKRQVMTWSNETSKSVISITLHLRQIWKCSFWSGMSILTLSLSEGSTIQILLLLSLDWINIVGFGFNLNTHCLQHKETSRVTCWFFSDIPSQNIYNVIIWLLPLWILYNRRMRNLYWSLIQFTVNFDICI